MGLDSNIVVISGRVTKDADIKAIQMQTETKKVLTFSLANSFRRKENETNFFDCEFWTKSDYYDSKLVKGNFIVAEGYLKQVRWLNKMDNTQRSKVVIVINKIISIEPKFSGNNQNYNSHDSSSGNDYGIQSQDAYSNESLYESNIGDGNFYDEDGGIY